MPPGTVSFSPLLLTSYFAKELETNNTGQIYQLQSKFHKILEIIDRKCLGKIRYPIISYAEKESYACQRNFSYCLKQ